MDVFPTTRFSFLFLIWYTFKVLEDGENATGTYFPKCKKECVYAALVMRLGYDREGERGKNGT